MQPLDTAGARKPFALSEKGRVLLKGDPTAAIRSTEEIRSFLAKRGETAYNLLAAYENANDPQWLKRALELYPNDPAVLFDAVGATLSEPERTALIERWKAADRSSPLPWLYSAESLFATDGAAARAALRESVSRSGLYLYTNERIAASKQLHEDSGLKPLEADRVATFTSPLPYLTIAMNASRALLPKAASAAEPLPPPPSPEDLRLAYDLARTFSTPESERMLINQLVSVTLERRALEAIPENTLLENRPVIPAQRLAELDKQKAKINHLVKSNVADFAAFDEPTIAEYLRRFHAQGEMRAMQWRQTQPKPAK